MINIIKRSLHKILHIHLQQILIKILVYFLPPLKDKYQFVCQLHEIDYICVLHFKFALMVHCFERSISRIVSPLTLNRDKCVRWSSISSQRSEIQHLSWYDQLPVGKARTEHFLRISASSRLHHSRGERNGSGNHPTRILIRAAMRHSIVSLNCHMECRGLAHGPDI